MAGELSAKSIHKNFSAPAGELVVLKDVTLSLGEGDSAVIMGPSGAGKSTLLNILGTLEPPTSGCVTLDGENPFELPERDLARFRNRRVGFVFQDHHLLPQCTALENVLLPTMAWPHEGDATERARQLLDRVGLLDRLDHRPAELSGGERQRVAIARSLIHRPSLLLADEPTGNLDQATADQVAALLFDLHHTDRVILVAVTHNEKLAARFAHRYDLVEHTLTSR